jgi:hypothetical protein
MREPLIIECLEYDRREWLSCLHQADRGQETELQDKQEPTAGGEPAATND